MNNEKTSKKKILIAALISMFLVVVVVCGVVLILHFTKDGEAGLKELGDELNYIAEQNDGVLPDITVDEKSEAPIFIDGSYSAETVTDFDSAIDSLNDIKTLMGIDNPEDEYREKSLATSDGNRFYKIQQYYKGIPVYGAELTVVTDTDGRTTCLVGDHKTINVSVNAAIDESAAIAVAENGNDGRIIKSQGMQIYISGSGNQFLVYVVDIGDNLDENVFIAEKTLFISAENGEIVGSETNIKNETYTGKGMDLSGNEREFIVEQENGIYYMTDLSKGIYIFTYNNTDDNAVQITSENNSWDNADAVSLMNNLSYTVSFYKDRAKSAFEYNKLSKIYGCVQYKNNENNAYSGTSEDGVETGLYFGDAKPYANCLDIVAHEFTHSVISVTCNLQYLNESGALNEAYADILGNLIENDDSKIWLLGEDHIDGGIRNLTNPHESNQPAKVDDEYMHAYCSKDHDHGNADCDCGGVHTNSGIVNHAAYLMWEDGMSKDDLISVFCKSLDYMNSTTGFLGCRAAVLHSARDLKFTTEKIEIIAYAFLRVGIKPNVISTLRGNLTGKVVDSKTSEGITDVKIVATQPLANKKTMRQLSSYSNTQGDFALILPQGTYEITLSLPGYKDYVIKNFEMKKSWEKTALEEVIRLEKNTEKTTEEKTTVLLESTTAVEKTTIDSTETTTEVEKTTVTSSTQITDKVLYEAYLPILENFENTCIQHGRENCRCAVALVDIDHDGIEEMIFQDGDSEQTRTHHVYMYQNRTAVYLGEYNAWHLNLYDDGKTIVGVDGGNGLWDIYHIVISGNTVDKIHFQGIEADQPPAYSSAVRFDELGLSVINMSMVVDEVYDLGF